MIPSAFSASRKSLVPKKACKPKDIQVRAVQVKDAGCDNCRVHERASREPTGVKSACHLYPEAGPQAPQSHFNTKTPKEPITRALQSKHTHAPPLSNTAGPLNRKVQSRTALPCI